MCSPRRAWPLLSDPWPPEQWHLLTHVIWYHIPSSPSWQSWHVVHYMHVSRHIPYSNTHKQKLFFVWTCLWNCSLYKFTNLVPMQFQCHYKCNTDYKAQHSKKVNDHGISLCCRKLSKLLVLWGRKCSARQPFLWLIWTITHTPCRKHIMNRLVISLWTVWLIILFPLRILHSSVGSFSLHLSLVIIYFTLILFFYFIFTLYRVILVSQNCWCKPKWPKIIYVKYYFPFPCSFPLYG